MFVLLSLIGATVLCYIVFLLFTKPKRKYKSVILLPLNGSDRENAGRIGYAVERLNIFGEDRNAQVWGIEDENRDYEKFHEMFCRYNCVKFAQIGDMPYLLNGIMNGDEKKLSHK